MNNKVGIIGSGSWATALANVLADNNYLPFLYTRKEEIHNEINNNHTNSIYFNDLKLNYNVKATLDKEIFKNVDYILICIPSKNIDDLKTYIPYFKENALFINATKGFDSNTGLGIYQKEIDIFKKANLKYKGLVSLLGPSFAIEVIEKQYTCITSTSPNEKSNKIVQKMFSNDYFRVYTNKDIIGCETSAGMKNIIALATGISKGLGLKTNTLAALITRGLNEIKKYGLKNKAKEKTFFSLACIGDLFLTCSSDESRNYQAGYIIGKNNSAKEFLKNNKMTVEGIEACKIIYNKSKEMNISLPITEGVYKIIFEDYKPSQIIKSLMSRNLKAE